MEIVEQISIPRARVFNLSLKEGVVAFEWKEANIIPIFRFNEIAMQGKCPDGKWTRKLLAYREANIFHTCLTHHPEICVNLVFKHIHAEIHNL